MSYQALYRVYRPKTFEEVTGQNYVVRTLKNAVKQDKIAHAYLFSGPRGTGKTSIAKIFAKAINCMDDNEKPCMKCENCLDITIGTHPDIIEIDAASNNGVEEVRNLIDKVKYAPIKAKYKVYIIDEVHMMSTGAFNALLKTIEEPPKHVIFILATTEPQKVLPTIISRCQRYDFGKVSETDMISRLKEIFQTEGVTCEEEVYRLISQLSDGCVRDALSIADQCIAYAGKNIQISDISEIYGLTTLSEKVHLLEVVKNKNVSELNSICRMYFDRGIDIKRLCNDFIELLKNTLIYDTTKDETLTNSVNKEIAESILHLFKQSEIFYIIDELIELLEKTKFSSNVYTLFEIVLLKIIYREDLNVHVGKEMVDNNKREDMFHVKHIDSNQNVQASIMNEKTDTVKYETNSKKVKPLKDEFVLQLLVGATKSEKLNDQNNFIKIADLTFDFDFAKQANLIKMGNIIASGSSYIVLVVENQAIANEINEKDLMGDFIQISEKVFDISKKIFAISKEQQVKVITEFKRRMKENSLPQPITFEITSKETIPNPDNQSDEDIVKELFGEDNILITED